MFSCELYEISKNNFSYRILQMAASNQNQEVNGNYL